MGWFSKSSDIPRKSSTALVEEIHAEFDSAQDRLLKRAYQILSVETSPTELAGKKLLELGFTNAPQVLAYTKKSTEVALSTQTAKLIQLYQTKYPTLKFITEDELARICKKYGLVFAPVSAYIGEVPSKNIEEIRNAPKLQMEDEPKDKCMFFYRGDFTTEATAEQKKIVRAGIPCKIDHYGQRITNNNAIVRESLGIASSICTIAYDYRSFKLYSRQGLFIAAPKSDFNLEGIESDTDFGYAKVTTIEVKDPIVFRYIDGGLQILSKWGLEANDPALANAIDN